MAALSMHNPVSDTGQIDLNDKGNDSSTEQFLMYGYKVVQCSKRYRHDWSVCPFAHTGEMAARRDPSRYLPIFCFHSKQRLPCPRGEECPYSHNLFEYWLHPQRYRTEMCQFGPACTRPVCFFAHGEHQLRHTHMPGGPQPVVAPPEPIPGLNTATGNFSNRELGQVTDPAVKQQQQLLALQAAAAGFSSTGSSQVRSELLPVIDHHHLPSSGPGLSRLMNGGGSMDMAALAQLSQGINSFNNAAALPASAPLSAPLPQLSPDLLAALQQMSGAPNGAPNGAGSPGSVGNGLVHHSGMLPPAYGGQLPRQQSSFAASGPPPLLSATSNPSLVDELAKQLAVMQMMHVNGQGSASHPLPQLSGMDDMLGQLTHMQSSHQQQLDSAVAAAGSIGFEDLLGQSCSTPLDLQHDHNGTYSCPLPAMYHSSALAGLLQGAPVTSASMSPLAAAQLAAAVSANGNGLATATLVSNPQSPVLSDTGRDAPSPGLRDTHNAQMAAGTAAAGRKGLTQSGGLHPWSAPGSPCTSSKTGSDLKAAVGNTKLATSSTGSSTSSSNGRLVSVVSDSQLNKQEGLAGRMPSLTAGIGPAEFPLLVVGDSAATSVGDGQRAVSPCRDTTASLSLGGAEVAGHIGQAGMGEEMAVKLLANLPEESVKKLLDLVAKQGVAA